MAVLMLILKTIGIIILVLLFILIYFLVVPIFYRFSLSYDDKLIYSISFNSLLHLISIQKTSTDENIVLYFFWKLIHFNIPIVKLNNSKENKSNNKVQSVKKVNSNKLTYALTSFPNIIRRFHIDLKHANVRFSMGEPDKTGMTLGLIAIIPKAHDSGNRIIGDFESEDSYFVGDFSLKGYVRLFPLIRILVKIIFIK